MSELLPMNDPKVVTALALGLRIFYRRYNKDKYMRPNQVLSRAFTKPTTLTGLPRLSARLLEPNEDYDGGCFYGQLRLLIERTTSGDWCSTAFHEWRHHYCDTIIVWVVAYRCNGRKLIRTTLKTQIKEILAAYFEQTQEPLPQGFLRRVLACRFCHGREPTDEEVELADKLIVSYRARMPIERAARVFEQLAAWREHLKRCNPVGVLAVIGSPPINLFGGVASDRFKEVSQMDSECMRTAILTEIDVRLDAVLVSTALAAERNQFHELEATRYADECMAQLEEQAKGYARLVKYLFSAENSPE